MDEGALTAGFAGGDVRKARAFPLVVDNTLRVVTLTGGGWRLYGCATQVFYETRAVTDITGQTLANASGEGAAPTQPSLVGAAAGTAQAGLAYGAQDLVQADAHSFVRGGLNLTLDPTQFEVVTVPLGQFVNLYLATAAATVHPVLQGPYQ